MTKYLKKKKEHIGLSPYALVFRGQKKVEASRLRWMRYSADRVDESDVKVVEELANLKGQTQLNWINMYGIDNVTLMERLSATFQIEKNILSDIMNPSIRPKVEEGPKSIFLTLKILQYDERKQALNIENLAIIFCEDYLLSFQEQSTQIFEPIRERIRRINNKIRTGGHDYLAFALIDVVVDNYIYILSLFGEKINALEDEMTTDPKKEILDRIYDLKQELNVQRKHINAAREMLFTLSKTDTTLIQPENHKHFKELQSNITEACELADNYREILYDLLNIYHTSMSTRLNEIMRVLTIISVIFIPITFIAGVYGTNFEHIPELHWRYGYYVMWLLMLAVIIGMIWYFRRKKWF